MAREDQNAWFDAMLMVPPEWRAEFCRFAETGEASDEFLAFASGNQRCREALEKALRADSALAAFVRIACGQPEGRTARPRGARKDVYFATWGKEGSRPRRG